MNRTSLVPSLPSPPLRTRTCTRTRALGLVRGAFVASLIFGAAVLCFLRSAKAEMGEGLVRFGTELMTWHDGTPLSDPRTLSLNGVTVRFTTLQTDLSVHAVLEHFHGECRARGGVARPDASRSPSSLSRALPKDLDGAFVWGSDTEGVIACVDTGRPLAVSELLARLERFSVTKDLADVGALRYVVARRSENTTTLLVLWTEGSAPLSAAFPTTGDAPGSDPDGVPRPEGGRRILSAGEVGTPYSITSYAVPGGGPERLRAFYETRLAALGFSVSRKGVALVAKRGDRSFSLRIAQKNAADAIVSVLQLS